jgi:hypothetical protein
VDDNSPDATMGSVDLNFYVIALVVPVFAIFVLRHVIILLVNIMQRQGMGGRDKPKVDRDSLTGKRIRDDAGRRFSINEPWVPKISTNWWRNESLFHLERRAIFSKVSFTLPNGVSTNDFQNWLLATHSCRFGTPGDYRTSEIAGFSIILMLGKDLKLRAFQNICRHRAYRVTKKECGRSVVLGCRYHGWAYDTRGRRMQPFSLHPISSSYFH